MSARRQMCACVHPPINNDQPSQRGTPLQSQNFPELWTEYGENPGNVSVRNQLVEKYLYIVQRIATTLHARLPNSVDIQDLKSAGVLGLMDAIAAFGVRAEIKFETYCVQRIRGAMLDELRGMDTVPRTVRSKSKQLNDARTELLQKNVHPATLDELAAYFDIDAITMERTIIHSTPKTSISLSQKIYETGDSKDVLEVELLEDTKAHDPAERISREDLFRSLLSGLNKTERLVMICYYILGMTMKEVGENLDLSLSHISQIHSEICERLQEGMEYHADHDLRTLKAHLFEERI